MGGFMIERVWPDFYNVLHNGERVAVLLPPAANRHPFDDTQPWTIHLDPVAFPDCPARGLPHPLTDDFMAFDTLEDVSAFLGIEQFEVAA